MIRYFEGVGMRITAIKILLLGVAMKLSITRNYSVPLNILNRSFHQK
ncbi:MAG TPA: hypothetical protein PLN01_12740 [Spirochaetota bacterium]|nr:hypothetical protein [Spirochaetota bacterium]